MKLLTVRELSGIINVKASTLYQWAELGQIPCLKLNGSLRFDMNRIEKWLSECKREPNFDYNTSTELEARKGGQKR